MRFTSVKKNELPMLASIYVKAFNQGEDKENWSEEVALKRLTQLWNRKEKVAYIMKKKEDIIGFFFGHYEIFYDGNVFVLHELVINPIFQKKGYGKILLNYVEKKVTKWNVKSILLYTTSSNMHLKFYNGSGYTNFDDFQFMKKKLKPN